MQGAISIADVSHTGEYCTPTKEREPASTRSFGPYEVDLTPYLAHFQMDGDERFTFEIDRVDKDCHTPRRNKDVERALDFFEKFSVWASEVQYVFAETAQRQDLQSGSIAMSVVDADDTFVPIVPLLEEKDGGASVLTRDDVGKFMTEQSRSLHEKFSQIDQQFAVLGGSKVFTAVEAKLYVTLNHAYQLHSAYHSAIGAIEGMLRDQLIKAIGRNLRPSDFTQLMRSHNRKLFKSEYRPASFCYAVQRPGHSPEGVVSLEFNPSADDMGILDGDKEDAGDQIVTSHVQQLVDPQPMNIKLNAATQVSLHGHRILHACLFHQFSAHSTLDLVLKARARQFSAFILLAGRIPSPTEFEPHAGIIIQNKDDLSIPIHLDTIPTPKDFRDAIESLSPEQQRFAKAMRSLQLESTLFGLCVIEIKPQLEKVLNLPPDALTKEIGLTRDLMNMFIKYQIPGDLMSFDGEAEASRADKLAVVKAYVARLKETIKESGQEDLDLASDRAKFSGNSAFANVMEAVSYQSQAQPEGALFGSAGGSPGAGAGIMKRGFSFGASPSLSACAPPPPPPTSAPMAPMAMRCAAPAPKTRMRMSAPSQAAQPQPTKVYQSEKVDGNGGGGGGDATVDFTRLPQLLEAQFEQGDTANAIRPSILKVGKEWKRSRADSILVPARSSALGQAEQRSEKAAAFDLLDALSRSGTVAVETGTVHVVVAATHCFDLTLLETVIQGNVNPVEAVERSDLLMARTVTRRAVEELVIEPEAGRVQALLLESEAAAA
ncbi:hypothetical protein DFS34DRAFT_618003 [Phlyctochytrium arcticum]|nr:hypothetical protein DFS34DRAFT_618003 [Phlyctochytrium arcticum]